MTTINLMVIHGGDDAGQAVQPFTVLLRKYLKPLADTQHSPDIDSFDIKLFVGGSMDKFTGDGSLEDPRVMKKKRYALGGFTMRTAVWRKGEPAIRAFLRDKLRGVIAGLAERIESGGLTIDTAALLADYDAATAGYVDA